MTMPGTENIENRKLLFEMFYWSPERGEDEDDVWTVSTTNQSSCGHEQQETRNKLEQEEILQCDPKLLQEHFFYSCQLP